MRNAIIRQKKTSSITNFSRTNNMCWDDQQKQSRMKCVWMWKRGLSAQTNAAHNYTHKGKINSYVHAACWRANSTASTGMTARGHCQHKFNLISQTSWYSSVSTLPSGTLNKRSSTPLPSITSTSSTSWINMFVTYSNYMFLTLPMINSVCLHLAAIRSNLIVLVLVVCFSLYVFSLMFLPNIYAHYNICVSNMFSSQCPFAQFDAYMYFFALT